MRKNMAAIAALALAGSMMPSVAPTAAAQQTEVRSTNKARGEQPAKPTEQSKDRRTTPVRSGASALPLSHFRRARHGWSNRHVQRMAVKKRNQARHRKACRG